MSLLDIVNENSNSVNIEDAIEELKKKHGGDGSPKSLKVPLYEHQIEGYAWMVKMEQSSMNGGILADDMGLGKTIQTIALILSNKPPSSQRIQSTLVVCPMSLLNQWYREITAMAKDLSVYIHYGPDRTRSKTTLRHYDVVLTSYAVIFSTNTITQLAVKPGPLFRARWYRIVLDEAHTIKNRLSQVSNACADLVACKRFCLTGTPIQNSADEMYSLFRFLKLDPFCDYKHFHDKIGRFIKVSKANTDSPDVVRGLSRLQSIVQACLKRRTKQSKKSDGTSILVLPPREIEIIQIEFSEAERDFYEALSNYALDTFKRYMGQGKVMKNYSHVLLMILRLRQTANHPHLVTERATETEDNDDSPSAKKLKDAKKIMSAAVFNRVHEQVNLESGGMLDEECPHCLDVLADPLITLCGHAFCRECISGYLSHTDGTVLPCPVCRENISAKTLTDASCFVEQPATPKVLTPEEGKALMDKSVRMMHPDGNYLDYISSSKIDKIVEILRDIEKDDPSRKTVIFSRFTSMLDLIEKGLQENGFPTFCRFDGALKEIERTEVLDRFATDEDCPIMLASTGAGAVGLNLTRASRIILVDVWWNPSVEDQAIDRAHRIGQTRDVKVYRLTIRNSIEDRILQLQEDKRTITAGVLGEGNIKVGRLSLSDLQFLFTNDRAFLAPVADTEIEGAGVKKEDDTVILCDD
ncbi:SNF2 family N-terminal domain-containing protein [Obelidium mucronatum]|nr:SNF2 family N-terminal domain-containing protein [Obelidium mucronatum]